MHSGMRGRAVHGEPTSGYQGKQEYSSNSGNVVNYA